jgi:hypothetical protein
VSRPPLTGPVLSATAIDHDWLREHLGWRLNGDELITVRPISHSHGDMGDVHRVSCDGRSIVFKGPPPDPEIWGGLIAEDRLIEREIECYRFLRESEAGALVIPECLWSVLCPDGRGALALEDAGPQPPLREPMAEGLSRTQAVHAVKALAGVHASRVERAADPRSAPFPWLYTGASDQLAAWVRWGFEDLPRLVAERWPEGLADVTLEAVLEADLGALFAEAHLGAHLTAFCHGDPWAGNILFVPAGAGPERQRAVLVDWQFAMWGNPMSDVALLLASSLAPESRAAWEADLVQAYRLALGARAGVEYPDSACWEDLHRAEPFAAAVALATLEAYTSGMGPEHLSRFGSRVTAAVKRLERFNSDRGAPR